MNPANDIAILYVPCGSEDEAVTITRTLLEEGLIACGNITESRSLYMWEGKPADEREQILVCKTTLAAAPIAGRRIEELHSYDVPCVITIGPLAVSESYARWVRHQVSGVGRLIDRAAVEDAAADAGEVTVEAEVAS